MRGTIIALALTAGCLGRYNAPADPPAPPPAKAQPQPSPSPSPQSPTPTPTPTPSPTPSPPMTPPASDGGTTTPPTSAPDGGSSPACAQLDSCCQQLPADQIDACLARVAGLDDAGCQDVLAALQADGYCS